MRGLIKEAGERSSPGQGRKAIYAEASGLSCKKETERKEKAVWLALLLHLTLQTFSGHRARSEAMGVEEKTVVEGFGAIWRSRHAEGFGMHSPWIKGNCCNWIVPWWRGVSPEAAEGNLGRMPLCTQIGMGCRYL
jgi:hypothetical protein